MYASFERSAGLDLYSTVDACIEIDSIKKINLEYAYLFQKILMDLLETNRL